MKPSCSLKACSAKTPPEWGVKTMGALCWARSRLAFTAASDGEYLSSSATTLSLSFFPPTSTPPASLISLAAISRPVSVLRP
jgi:hypothetical protein